MISSFIKIIFCFSMLCVAALSQIPLLYYNTEGFAIYQYSPIYLICFILALIFRNNYVLFAVILYLIAGLAGLPIFAFGGGWRYIFEPSFGHLLSLVVLVVASFYYFHHEVDTPLKTFRGVNAAPLLGIVIAHIFALIFLLATGRLNGENFSNLSLYQFLYDIFFAHLVLLILPVIARRGIASTKQSSNHLNFCMLLDCFVVTPFLLAMTYTC